MNVKEINGETKLTFGVKEWLALVAFILAGVASVWDTRNLATQNREDIASIVKSLEVTSEKLEGIIRADERIKAVEHRVDRLERTALRVAE